jgi:competence protein ComEC
VSGTAAGHRLPALLALPLVSAAAAYIAGVAAGLRAAPAAGPLLALALLLLLGGGYLWTRARRPQGRWVVLAGFLALGAAAGGDAALRAASDCRAVLPEGARLTVHGHLEAGAIAVERGGRRLLPTVPLRPTRVEHEGRALAACTGALRVRLPEAAEGLRAGAPLVVEGQWRRGSFTALRTAWPRDPRLAGTLWAGEVRADPAAASHLLLGLRGSAEARLHRLFPRHGGVADALLLGRRETLDPALRETFARAGLAHLLAISGMHVGLLAGFLMLLAGALRLGRRAAIGATLATLAAYLALIGAPPSALRAGLMLALVLTTFLLQRPAALLPAVALAAWLILLLSPLTLLNPGFQLSFGGVLSILVARAALLPGLPPAWRERGWRRWLSEGVVVSGAAFLGTLPASAHHFQTVAPAAIVANLPAVPLLGVALAGVTLALLLDPLLPPLAALLADGAGATLDLLTLVARLFGSLPGAQVELARPNWALWLVAGMATLLALDASMRLRRPFRAGIVTSVLGALLLAWPAVGSARGPALELHFLDVGQGDATLVRTPGGRWVMIDAGPRSAGYDAGERRVLPYLRAHRVRALEALVLTHPHADHVGGAPAVLRRLPVRRLVDPGYVHGSPYYLETLELAEERGVAWEEARPGVSFVVDGILFDVLGPERETVESTHDANEASVIVRVVMGGFAALFTGDASVQVESRLVREHGTALRSAVLKAGHHGSSTSTSELFLRAVRPEAVVISAGSGNRYGHPAPAVMARLQAHGVRVLRTDRDGTVVLRVPAGGTWELR